MRWRYRPRRAQLLSLWQRRYGLRLPRRYRRLCHHLCSALRNQYGINRRGWPQPLCNRRLCKSLRKSSRYNRWGLPQCLRNRHLSRFQHQFKEVSCWALPIHHLLYHQLSTPLKHLLHLHQRLLRPKPMAPSAQLTIRSKAEMRKRSVSAPSSLAEKVLIILSPSEFNACLTAFPATALWSSRLGKGIY